jgi:hypothetical protein
LRRRHQSGKQLAESSHPILGILGAERNELDLEIRRAGARPLQPSFHQAEKAEATETMQIELDRADTRPASRLAIDQALN